MPVPNAAGAAAYAVLSSSLPYGVVARSLPLDGYRFRGYLDAAGTLNGLGVGNPNAEFSPDLTKCAMSSEGGIAKVLWGFRTGAVAVTNAPKAVDKTRQVSARWTRCQVTDAHEGSVEDAIWAGTAHAVTGGADGRVKVWDVRRMSCIWTSPLKQGQVIRDPCVKVASDLANGFVVGFMKSGEIAVWSGFSSLSTTSAWDTPDFTVSELRIPPQSSIPPVDPSQRREIKALHIYATSSQRVSILILHEAETVFRRILVDIGDSSYEWSTFGGNETSIITALQPVFSTKENEKNFILTGDQTGNVSVYPWNATTPIIHASSKFEAFNDSAITALGWSPTVLVAGSSKGTLRAFDSFSFAYIRNLNERTSINTATDPVSHIVVHNEVLVASIGTRVLGWFAGPVGKDKQSSKTRSGKLSKSHALAKWQRK